MGLYTLLHGRNPLSAIFLKVLDIDQPEGKWHSGRFRDIYVNEDGTQIILYTRNGGGNRGHWNDEKAEGPDCDCPGCTISYHLPQHPNYLSDKDDDFDSTYAYVNFSVPSEYAELVKSLSTGEKPETIREKFVKTMAEMKEMSAEQMEADPRFKPVCDALKSLVGAKEKKT